MEKTEPARAYWTKLALWSYGLLTQRPEKPAPKTEGAGTFAVADEIADRLNVPRGVHVTLEEFVDLTLKPATQQEPVVPVKIGGSD
jgi:hypothetical protein